MSVTHDLDLKRSPPPHVTEQPPHEAQSPQVPTDVVELAEGTVVVPSVDDTEVVESLPATHKIHAEI